MSLEEKPLAFRAWYGVMAVHGRVLDRVAGELERETGLAAPWFELLACLNSREGGRERMSELANELLLSRGGATRLVARLEEIGYVDREIPPDDRRATFAVLTPKGRDVLERAMPVVLDAVSRHFSAPLDDEDIAAVARAMGKVLAVLDPTCGVAASIAPEAADADPAAATPPPPPPS